MTPLSPPNLLIDYLRISFPVVKEADHYQRVHSSLGTENHRMHPQSSILPLVLTEFFLRLRASMEPLPRMRLLLSQLIRIGQPFRLIASLRCSRYQQAQTCGHSFLLLVSVSFLSLTILITDFYPEGADDDGSGTVTILEAYRALLESDFKPNRTVEFHWYSAEVCSPPLLQLQAELNTTFRRVASWAPKPLPETTEPVVSKLSP